MWKEHNQHREMPAWSWHSYPETQIISVISPPFTRPAAFMEPCSAQILASPQEHRLQWGANCDLVGVLGGYSFTEGKTIMMTSKLKVAGEITSFLRPSTWVELFTPLRVGGPPTPQVYFGSSHAHTHTHIYIYNCIYIYIYMCIYIYICIYIYMVWWARIPTRHMCM